ncbi:uncharacterized protein [Diadema antillarum]|uniref:uncharacterized protein n=1 Tax=Diadema antillarum TaxID=105358 RepID=UPI003A89015C
MAEGTDAPDRLTQDEGSSSEDSGPVIMTEFVIAITTFCSLIFVFSVAICILFIHFKRIHRDDDEDDEEGTYVDEEEIESQRRGEERKTRPKPPPNHLLSVWGTYRTYHVREMTVAEKFWRADSTIRNPMHNALDNGAMF